MPNRIYFGDNLPILAGLPAGAFDLIYIDPPFNTGKVQARTQIRDRARPRTGDRVGFQGNRYQTTTLGTRGMSTSSTTIWPSWSRGCARPTACWPPTARLYFHIDYREVHYCKVLLDGDLRARMLSQRGDLGVRLRRAHATTAGRPSTTTSWST